MCDMNAAALQQPDNETWCVCVSVGYMTICNVCVLSVGTMGVYNYTIGSRGSYTDSSNTSGECVLGRCGIQRRCIWLFSWLVQFRIVQRSPSGYSWADTEPHYDCLQMHSSVTQEAAVAAAQCLAHTHMVTHTF